MSHTSNILDDLANPTLFRNTDKLLKELHKDWDTSREVLVSALNSDRSALERANATLLLFAAEDEGFIEGFSEVFTQDNESSVLENLLEGIFWSTTKNSNLEKTLQADSIRDTLKYTITRAEGKLLDKSLNQYRKTGGPDSSQFLNEQFADASGPRKLQIAFALCIKADHPDAWATIAANADQKPPQDWPSRVRNAIQKHQTSSNPDLRRQAESLVAQTIEQFISEKGFTIEQSTSRAFLENARLPESLPAIRQLEERAIERQDSIVEGHAIEARARLEEKPSPSALESKLGDKTVSLSAARALLELHPGPPDDAQFEKIIEAAGKSHGSNFKPFMILVRDCGHPKAHDSVRTILKEKAPGLVLRILGQSDGWNAEKLGDLAAKCGLLPSPPTPAQIKKAEDLCENPENPDDLASALLHLGGCLFEFDLEADEIPPNYESLIKDLSKITGEQFLPTHIKSDPLPGDDGACMISFRLEEQLYEAQTQGLGDWIDEVTLLKTLNDAIANTGSAGRLRPFEPHGQHLQVVFAEPEAFEEFSRQTGIALAKNFETKDEAEEDQEKKPEGFWARLKKKFQRS